MKILILVNEPEQMYEMEVGYEKPVAWMKKMGWVKGQGLGGNNNGISVPIEKPGGILLDNEDPKGPRGLPPRLLSLRYRTL